MHETARRRDDVAFFDTEMNFPPSARRRSGGSQQREGRDLSGKPSKEARPRRAAERGGELFAVLALARTMPAVSPAMHAMMR